MPRYSPPTLSWPLRPPHGGRSSVPIAPRLPSRAEMEAAAGANGTAALARWTERWISLWEHLAHGSGPEDDHALGRGAAGSEVALVLGRVRPAARIVVSAWAVAAAARRAASIGLWSLPAPFAFETIRLHDDDDYTDEVRVLEPDDDHSDAKTFLYLAPHRRAVWRLWALELSMDDLGLGVELGYPKCCCKQWAGTQSAEGQSQCLERRWWPLNELPRVWGLQILSHSPCRSGCEESLELARRYVAHLRAVSPTNLLKVERFLRKTSIVFPAARSFLALGEVRQIDEAVFSVEPSAIYAFGEPSRAVAARLCAVGGPVDVWIAPDSTLWIQGGERLTGEHCKVVSVSGEDPGGETSS